MRDLASTLSDLPDVQRPAPWAGHEYVKGWAVFALPYDSGHVLALRVLPEANLDPYRSLWHRDPDGTWALYVDAPKGPPTKRANRKSEIPRPTIKGER